jgi:predicted GNAT family acetyltransferase
VNFYVSFGELSKASGHFLGLRNMASAGVSAVQHDEKRHKFFIPMESTRKEALLSYALPKNDVIDLQHTFVPDEFRGKGIAAQLVEKVLD